MKPQNHHLAFEGKASSIAVSVKLRFTSTSFDVPIHKMTRKTSDRIEALFSTLSARGEAAKPTSAEVAQKYHLEAPACQPANDKRQADPRRFRRLRVERQQLDRPVWSGQARCPRAHY